MVGAALAFALCAGSAAGLVRQLDRASAVAAVPLPLMAIYATANDLLALVRGGPPYEGIVFIGGPVRHRCGDLDWCRPGDVASG